VHAPEFGGQHRLVRRRDRGGHLDLSGPGLCTGHSSGGRCLGVDGIGPREHDPGGDGGGIRSRLCGILFGSQSIRGSDTSPGNRGGYIIVGSTGNGIRTCS
jgi:hypothetical protein